MGATTTSIGARFFPVVIALAALALLLSPGADRNGGSLNEALSPVSSVLVETFDQLPLSFEANNGQLDSQVRFVARADGFSAFLTEDGVTMAIGRGVAPSALLMTFAGGNTDPEVVPGTAMPGIANYFLGNDPAGWITKVPTYESVTYRQVYPGVDAVFYGNPGELEYDFVIAPGTSPEVIRLRFEGAEGLNIDSDGNLVASIGGGELVQSAPVVYQEVDGVRQPVPGAYALRGASEVGFEIGAYDETRPLVIDPVLRFGSYLGGDMRDIGWGVATDEEGNVYVTGQTQSADFPTTDGVFDQSFNGETNQPDVFVTKISADGSEVLYSTYLGGDSSDIGYDIEVDAEGQAFVVGIGRSGFPTTPGAFVANDNQGGFVTKLSEDGSELLYSTKLGTNTQAFGLEIDGAGQAYVAGHDLQGNFEATAGSFQPQPVQSSNGDGIVAVLNDDGSALVWGSYIGGQGREFAYDIARDANGYVYVTGETPAEDFPTVNAFQGTKGAQNDAFVVKIMPDGSSLVYSTYLG